jgi:hypothetical protein
MKTTVKDIQRRNCRLSAFNPKYMAMCTGRNMRSEEEGTTLSYGKQRQVSGLNFDESGTL